jgi:NAD(P)H-nitrite reductase large subunit
MESCRYGEDCTACPERLVCHCLQVTEADLLTALSTQTIRTVKDIRRHTGAGDGCTACHKLLRRYLELVVVQPSSSDSPICSVR